MTATKHNRWFLQPGGVRHTGLVLVFLWLALGLTGCTAASGTPTSEPFIPAAPPIETPTPFKTTQETAPAVEQLAPPACIDNLTWLADVTVPDGTEVDANSTIDKRWEVENSGNCNWDERYRIRLVAGPALGAAQEQALFPARAGTKAVIQIVLQAPSDPGKYLSAWQAYNPDGQPFGDEIFIDFVVP